jgi:hypothetical protein
LRQWLDQQAQARLVAEYQAGYLRRPEGPGEIKAAEAAAVQLLSTEKWWMRLSEARGESTAS